MTNKRITQRWNDADKFAFATQRLRASTMPNKKALERKNACRSRGKADF
jgi:hypothetical protein